MLDALATVNGGHVGAYGADPYTAHLQTVVQRHFGEQASCWPVFNGTGANVVALSAMTDRWDAVIATGHAHIHTDECGAPEKVAGIKVVTVPTADAIMTPALLDREAYGFGFEHHAQPRVVSLTQSTEVGTVHSPTRSGRSPTTRTRSGCSSTSTAPGSPTPLRRWASRCER